jgi:hypothetical protein
VSLSKSLMDTIAPAAQAVGSATARLHHPDVFPDLVADWFQLLFHVVRHSTPLMQATLQCCQRAPGDRAHQIIGRYMERHLDEEQGHQDLLAEDMRHMTKAPRFVDPIIPPRSITAMVGGQYALVEAVHPAAHLGYIALLEGFPAPRDRAEMLIARSGQPRKAWRTYLLHASVDVAHRSELCAIIDELPPSALVRRAMVRSALDAAQWYIDGVNELVESYFTWRSGRGSRS